MAASQGTKAAPTIISNTGNFGETGFSGYDGVAYREGAIIRGSVDGTPALNSMPGRLVFMTTPSGSITPIERMRISADGTVNIVGTTTLSTSTISSSTITNLNTNNLSLTGLIGTRATLSAATVTNLYVNTISFDGVNTANSTITNSTSTNLRTNLFVAATSSITNLNVLTNLFANIFNAVTATITTLWGTTGNFLTLNASTTNATTSNFIGAIGTRATITSATTTNLATFNFTATGTASITAVIVGNATSTNSTSTNKFVTNLRATNASFTVATTTSLAARDIVTTGATTFGSITLTNLGSSGAITTTANIDAYTVFNLPQTTPNVVPTIPSPTDTTAGKIIYINNTGTVPFQIGTTHIQATSSRAFIWNGTDWSIMNEAQGSGTQIKIKGSDQSTSTSVLTNDDDLFFSIGANETIIFFYDLVVNNSNNAGPDFRAAILGPAGSTCRVSMSGEEPAGAAFPQVNVTNCTTPANIDNTSVNAATIDFNVRLQGSITSGGTGGLVRLQFAQRVTTVGFPTIVRAGSLMHAYKATGADLAEIYYSKDATIGQGDIVSIAGDGPAQIQKTEKKYQSNSLGIVSTKPGLILADADGEGKPIVVALSGRVPVKVSGVNGSIKSGDFITSSNIPGVGMKSTDAGQVVGQAMNDFVATSTESVGTVMVFIKNQYYDGGDEYIQSATSTTLADGTIADRFTHLFRRAFEKITNIFLDMTLWIRNLKTDKVQTKELCIDDVCVTKEQLQQMLLNSTQNNSNNNIGQPNPTSTDPIIEPTPTSTEPIVDNTDVNVDNDVTSSSTEQTTESIPEPEPTSEVIPPTEENNSGQNPENLVN